MARLIGLVAGVYTAFALSGLLGQGLSDAIGVLSCGMSFAAMAVHPGAWTYFTVFAAAGWMGLEDEKVELTVNERLYGESAGVITAMVAILFLQWWQKRQARLGDR